MYKAINYWTFGPDAMAGEYDVVTAMKQARDAGFDAIELCLAPTGELRFGSSESQCKKLVAEARKIGIKICGVATGVYWAVSPTAMKKSVRDKALKFTKQGLQVARWLGVKTYLYIPGAVKPEFDPAAPVVPYGDVHRWGLQQAKAAAKAAEKNKVYLCIENVWNMFLYSPVEMRDFITAVGSRYAASYFDPGNVVKNGYPEHWVPVLGKMIKRVHCKDYSKKRGGFPEGFEIPIGSGDTNWPVILKQLKKIGYKGPITAEIITFKLDRGLVKRTSRQMDKILATV